MRIIGGELRRRKIEPPKDAETTRPMPDYVREAIFNLLRGHTQGEVVVDLFSGTGAVGLEAISRGASRCVFVERDRKMASVIDRNIETLGVGERSEVVRGDALGPLVLARCPAEAHLIFFDPPYPMVRDGETWERCRVQLAKLIERLDDTGYLVLRTPRPAVRRLEARAQEDSDDQPRRQRKGKHLEVKSEIDEDGEAMVEIDGSDWTVEDWADAEDLSDETGHVEPIDLSIDGALGPETHDYGKMSVHLYMRRR